MAVSVLQEPVFYKALYLTLDVWNFGSHSAGERFFLDL